MTSAFTHEQVWRAIDSLAAAHNHSPSGLAKRADLDSTAFNKSKRFTSQGEPRWPSMKTIAAICTVTTTTLTDFAAMVEGAR